MSPMGILMESFQLYGAALLTARMMVSQALLWAAMLSSLNSTDSEDETQFSVPCRTMDKFLGGVPPRISCSDDTDELSQGRNANDFCIRKWIRVGFRGNV